MSGMCLFIAFANGASKCLCFFCVPRMIKHDVSLMFPHLPCVREQRATFKPSRGAIELCGQGGFPSWWCSWTSTLVSCLSLIVQSDTNPTEHGCYCPGIMSRHCFWLAYCWNPVLGRNRYAHTHIFLIYVHPWSLTARPWNLMVGRWSFPFWGGLFSGRTVKLPGSIPNQQNQGAWLPTPQRQRIHPSLEQKLGVVGPFFLVREFWKDSLEMPGTLELTSRGDCKWMYLQILLVSSAFFSVGGTLQFRRVYPTAAVFRQILEGYFQGSRSLKQRTILEGKPS